MAKFMEERIVDCPHCQSERVIKKGRRNGHQRYECKDCRRKFDTSGRSFGRPNQTEHIGLVLQSRLW